MTKIGWAGWILAAFLFAALMLQRSCSKSVTNAVVTKTVQIAGDIKYATVHDTVLKLKRDTIRITSANRITKTHDTVFRYVYASIHDTVRADDVDVAVTDSLMPDSAIEQKVRIKNNRPITQTIILPQKNKLFIGFQAGLALKLNSASLGPSFIFVTKQDHLYQVGFDLLSGTPWVGMAWKIHFGKN